MLARLGPMLARRGPMLARLDGGGEPGIRHMARKEG
jgi:hypothetical protein